MPYPCKQGMKPTLSLLKSHSAFALHSCPLLLSPRHDSVQVAFRSYEQDGDWLLGLARTDAGESNVFVWTAPMGVDTVAAASAARLVTVRNGDCTRYLLSLPYEAIGLSPKSLRRSGLRFNFMVNDNDGEGRDGWIECAPGISTGRDATLYPFVRFQ